MGRRSDRQGCVTTRKNPAAVALGTLGLAPGAVMAHEETALYALAVVQDVSQNVDGLEIRVAQLTAPVVIASNKTADALVVDGVDGEPFLRISDGDNPLDASSVHPESYPVVERIVARTHDLGGRAFRRVR